jgi:hypothetical protein
MDECCALALTGLFAYVLLQTPDWRFNKAFLLTLGVFLFYTVYSFWIGSNSGRGIFNDLVIQMKPYLAFFCVYQLKPALNDSRRKLLRDVILLFWTVLLLPVGVYALANEKILKVVFFQPAFYAINVTLLAICYLYCCDFSRRTKIIYLLLLSIGIVSGRSKFYGFFTLSVFMMFFFSNIAQFKLNARNVLLSIGMLASIIVVAWRKIAFYFYLGITNSGDFDKDMIARLVLYYYMPDILLDYFPFGSGLASYATSSSGEWYSHVYEKYGIDNVWGISKSYHSFISDTYYPSLAQFGVVGIALFLLFWVYLLRKTFLLYRITGDIKSLISVILIVGFLIIESTTNATFISQGGLLAMMLLGLILSDMHKMPAVNRKP